MTQTGETVQEILQFGTKGIIFLNKKGELVWEYDDSCPNGVSATGFASGLNAQASILGLRRTGLRRVQRLIAAGLASAFDDPTPREGASFFDDARALLLVAQTETLQRTYLISVLLVAAAISSIGLYFASLALQPYADFALASAMGSVGALVSVSQRFGEIKLERYASRSFTSIAAVARVFLGAIFGAVLFLLQRGGIVLSVTADNRYTLAAFALAAGFSERLVPDLIGALEAKVSKNLEGA